MRSNSRPSPDRSTDARQRPAGSAETALQADYGQPSRLAGRAEPARPGLHGNKARQKWGADISYVWTREGWLYLAIVIDLFARRVVGWATSDRLHRDLALAALRKALTMRRPAAGLIHHSDRGSQGGFKRWSQHGRCLRIEATDQVSLPAFSNRASFGVGS